MALLLKKQGIQRIRPLQGGLNAWRERGYPLSSAGNASPTERAPRG